MIIVLMGYMASGKSTIGKILAKKLDYNFVDLDDYIEKKEKTSVSDIFKTKGEIYFRKLETSCLKQIINNNERVVLSLGGGTPCYGNNMQLISDTNRITSMYIKASVSTLVNRLESEKFNRPLIANINTNEALTEFVSKHLFERSYYYNMSNYKIPVDNKSELQIIEDIVAKLF